MSRFDTTPASQSDWLKTIPQYLLPHHALSRLVLMATRLQITWWKNLLINIIRRHFNISLDEARLKTLDDFPSFNHFFTRELRADARPLATDAGVVSPVDGCISQIGAIDNGSVFQAKGRSFDVLELLGGDREAAEQFRDGRFTTLYLSPRDYHRIHMPLTGTLKRTIYVPGRLFSVAPHTVRTVPRLFARNERLVCLFDTEAGPMAMVAVGALFVSCIETVWSGVETPPHGYGVRIRDYPESGNGAVTLERGAEMGRFNMGSTVVLLFGKERVEWLENLTAPDHVKMGQAFGNLLSSRALND